MERPPHPKGDPILYFTLDGLRYALRQNQMTTEEAYDNLKKWFPDVEIEPDWEQLPLPFKKGVEGGSEDFNDAA